MIEIVLKNKRAVEIIALLQNGKSPYSNKTKQNFLNEELIVLPYDEAMKLVYKNENIKYLQSWEKITEDAWLNALEELLPLNRQFVDGYDFFFCSEAYTSNIHQCYCEVDGRYYTTKRRTTTSYITMVEELKEKYDFQ